MRQSLAELSAAARAKKPTPDVTSVTMTGAGEDASGLRHGQPATGHVLGRPGTRVWDASKHRYVAEADLTPRSDVTTVTRKPAVPAPKVPAPKVPAPKAPTPNPPPPAPPKKPVKKDAESA